MGTFIIAVLFIALVFILFQVFGHTPEVIIDRWEDYYDTQFSGQDFHERVKAAVESLELPGVKIGKEGFRESHLLSDKREYLRVARHEYNFYVAGVPYGKGSYVSWWLTETNERPINKIPLISKWLGKDRNNKTFHQLDTEQMFRSVVHSAVTEVIKTMNGYENVRPYNPANRVAQSI